MLELVREFSLEKKYQRKIRGKLETFLVNQGKNRDNFEIICTNYTPVCRTIMAHLAQISSAEIEFFQLKKLIIKTLSAAS